MTLRATKCHVLIVYVASLMALHTFVWRLSREGEVTGKAPTEDLRNLAELPSTLLWERNKDYGL